MVIRLHKKRSVLVTIFLYFLFQQALMTYTTGTANRLISYSDELVECGLIVLVALSFFCKKVKITQIEYRMLACYVIFFLFGLLSNLVHPMQRWFLNLTDMLVCSRFVVFYYAVRILVPGFVDSKKLLLDLAKVCRGVAVVLTVLALHDVLFDPFFPKKDYRYFMYSLQLCFGHPTYLAVASITCALILLAAMEYDQNEKQRRNNLICMVLLLLLVCTTMRTKAIASVVCVIVFYFMIVKWNARRKTLLLGGGSIIAVAVGWERVQFFFVENLDRSVRARLMTDAVALATDYFPLGTGFATFGSAVAADSYSMLYTVLGYNALHGGSRDDPRYLSDTFWPTVIAQTGWIGFLCFVGILCCLFILAFRMQRGSRYLYCATLSMLIYELIASTSEAALFNPPVAVIMAIFALLVCVNEQTLSSKGANSTKTIGVEEFYRRQKERRSMD